MTLSKNQFEVLNCLRKAEARVTQRQISEVCDLSLGSVNAVLRDLKDKCLIRGDNSLTALGLDELKPYEVSNAIIMAAGMSSRFAPLSYERPKGVLKVKGEVLIERQIQQLLEAGIRDITVVVGYKKEEFFYLADKYGVNILVNPDYAKKNNYYTIWLARNLLANSYICSSDDYFVDNPFDKYVYQAYYSCVYEEGYTSEYCVDLGSQNRITRIYEGGSDSLYMLGHVYFDKNFSKTFIDILTQEIDNPGIVGMLWEDVYAKHVDELYMIAKEYQVEKIYEFDSLDELRSFDPLFIKNVNSDVLNNIASVLHCQPEDIHGIVPLKTGLTNLSFKFEVNNSQYVYRHPGVGTEEIISRESETFSNQIAYDLGIDTTFIYEDVEQGWKICRYISDCVPFDYHNWIHVEKAMSLGRTLHKSGAVSQWTFDIWDKTVGIVDILASNGRTEFEGFNSLYTMIKNINNRLKKEDVPRVLCHNDFFDANFLVKDDTINLIDWEYSGMSDYASDLGTFICCSDYSKDEVNRVLELYFGRSLTASEYRHCVGYIALSSFYWFVWALFKDMTGNPVGEYQYIWYKYALQYGQEATSLFVGE